jgi:hypothetical protein
MSIFISINIANPNKIGGKTWFYFKYIFFNLSNS